MREFRPKQLAQYLSECAQAPLLLDVRETWEFDICKLPDSILVPMSQIPGYINELDPGQEVVIICHHGIRSRQVARFMEYQGFKNVINLNGGLDAWAFEVDHSMSTY